MEHICQTFISTGQCTGSDHQTNQYNEQNGHQDRGHFFDTSSTMADDPCCQEHEDKAPNQCTNGEAVCTQHVQEVCHRISPYCLYICDISYDVVHSPTTNLTVVTYDDETCQNAQTTDPCEFFIQHSQGTYRTSVCFTTDCEFSHHYGCTYYSNDDQVDDQECAAATCVSFAGEFPDVTQTYSGTSCGQDET